MELRLVVAYALIVAMIVAAIALVVWLKQNTRAARLRREMARRHSRRL